MVRRNPAAALRGTRIERKTSISRTRARPTTTHRYGIRASLSLFDRSMLTAVVPVTINSAPVSPCRVALPSRMSETRSTVCLLSGELFGTALIMATSPVALKTTGLTEATSGSLSSRATASAAAALGSSLPRASTTTLSGPL